LLGVSRPPSPPRPALLVWAMAKAGTIRPGHRRCGACGGWVIALDVRLSLF